MLGYRDAQVVRDLMMAAKGLRVEGYTRMMKNAGDLAERLEGKPRCDEQARRRRNMRKKRACL